MQSNFSLGSTERQTTFQNPDLDLSLINSRSSHQSEKGNLISVVPPFSKESLNSSAPLSKKRFRVLNPSSEIKPFCSKKKELTKELTKQKDPNVERTLLKRTYAMEFKEDKDVLTCCLGDEKIKREVKRKGEFVSKIHSKTIAERIEKNRAYALAQQAKQKKKGFKVENKALPDEIKVFVPKEGEKERKISREKLELNGRKVGMACCQGMRPTMEDAELVAHQSFKVKDGEHSFDLFGVFDGHGGIVAPAYVKLNIVPYLKNALEYHNQETLTDDGIFYALKACCQKLGTDYPGFDGTTVTMAMVLSEKIWVANVGDSRTILVKDGKAIQVSEDAKPEMERYEKTIKKLGGFVIKTLRTSRVNGILSVARAIGNKHLLGENGECCVSSSPKIAYYLLEDFKEGYLVLGCDGLFDLATTDEVGQAITIMESWGESVENMSTRLVYNAIARGSTDNVTVIVIKL